jgi:hypothetical protein
MPRFRLLPNAAPHQEGDGETYRAGDEFDSDNELDVAFPGKFERLEGRTKKGRDHDDSLDQSGRVMDDAEHLKVKKAVKTRLPDVPKAGKSSTSKQGAAARGEDEDEYPEVDDAETEAEGEEDEASPTEEDEDLGADVTDQFHAAPDAGLSVFKGEKGYLLAKDGKKVGKPIPDKKSVAAAIRKAKIKK